MFLSTPFIIKVTNQPRCLSLFSTFDLSLLHFFLNKEGGLWIGLAHCLKVGGWVANTGIGKYPFICKRTSSSSCQFSIIHVVWKQSSLRFFRATSKESGKRFVVPGRSLTCFLKQGMFLNDRFMSILKYLPHFELVLLLCSPELHSRSLGGRY